VELAGVLPGEGEILWDLEDPAYVEVTAGRETVLLDKGQKARGWVLTDAEVLDPAPTWIRRWCCTVRKVPGEQREGASTRSLLCSRALIHLAGAPVWPAASCRSALCTPRAASGSLRISLRCIRRACGRVHQRPGDKALPEQISDNDVKILDASTRGSDWSRASRTTKRRKA